jgi:predicted phage terminase large subunit-like protein
VVELSDITLADLDRADVEEGGLAEFTRLAWPQVVPKKLEWNWHHDVMCRYLERLYSREIQKLAIWVPPGSTKTLLTSVFGPAWIWTYDPERTGIHTTYGGDLALKSARQMRDLVNGPWYQERWPDVSIPYTSTRAAKFFENDHKGFRFSGSVGGELTGRHAMDIAGDDLNKAEDSRGLSGAAFQKSWDFWNSDLATRRADPRSTTYLQIGQRLHVDDVAGRWVRDDPEVTVLCLPMRGDPRHPYVCPEDHREEGELLWPSRFSEADVLEMERKLGPSGAAAQLQQSPIPPGGQLLKDEYLSHRYRLPPSSIQRALETGRAEPGQVWGIYGDLAFKGKVTSDYVVYQLWCREGGLYWLLDQIRGQWGFRETKERGRDYANRFSVAYWTRLEDAANAAAMEEDLRGEIKGLSTIPHGGGTLARTQQVEGLWASGCVMLPESAPWMGGSDGFVAEHLGFDGLGTRHDDQVSCSSLALLDLSGGSSKEYAEILRGLK